MNVPVQEIYKEWKNDIFGYYYLHENMLADLPNRKWKKTWHIQYRIHEDILNIVGKVWNGLKELMGFLSLLNKCKCFQKCDLVWVAEEGYHF